MRPDFFYIYWTLREIKMPTPQQIKLIQIARRQVGLEESAYRILLRNVANVDSCTKLGNRGVEDVMAVLEDMGFRQIDQPGDYWRQKVRQRESGECPERMVRLIFALAAETKYEASGMALRHSHGRTEIVEQLEYREAYEVIEALKAIKERDAAAEAKMATKENL